MVYAVSVLVIVAACVLAAAVPALQRRARRSNRDAQKRLRRAIACGELRTGRADSQ